MSRLGITFEDVAHAAFSIQQNGENPTIDKIRAFLGGTGSNTTISKYLSAWRSQVHLVTESQDQKLTTPDVVKAAVDRVWQEMRDSTNAEITAITEEAKKLIGEADAKVNHVENEMTQLKQLHASLTETYHAVCAEKELSLLDLKQLREAYHLLEERHAGFEQKHEELQRYLTQYASDLSNAHQLEIKRLNEAGNQQKETYEKLIDEMKAQYEAERRQHMLHLDNAKVEQKKQAKTTIDLLNEVKHKSEQVMALKAQLELINHEKVKALEDAKAQAKQWTVFNDKVFVDQTVLQKIRDMPAVLEMTAHLKAQLSTMLDEKLLSLTDRINSLIMTKETDATDEEKLVTQN